MYPEPESNRHGFPQVFETSASTNSAIRALQFLDAGRKTSDFFCIHKKIVQFLSSKAKIPYKKGNATSRDSSNPTLKTPIFINRMPLYRRIVKMRISATMYQPLRNSIEKFIKLTDEEWQMLLPFLEMRKLKKQQYFFPEGKVANEVGFVLEGMLRHFYTKDGEEKTTYFYFENHFVSS